MIYRSRLSYSYPFDFRYENGMLLFNGNGYFVRKRVRDKELAPRKYKCLCITKNENNTTNLCLFWCISYHLPMLLVVTISVQPHFHWRYFFVFISLICYHVMFMHMKYNLFLFFFSSLDLCHFVKNVVTVPISIRLSMLWFATFQIVFVITYVYIFQFSYYANQSEK